MLGTIALSLYNEVVRVRKDNNRPRFIGIEVVPEAVNSAKENARLNRIPLGTDGVEFIVGKAEAVLPDLLENLTSNYKDDLEIFAIVDPPRGGLRK